MKQAFYYPGAMRQETRNTADQGKIQAIVLGIGNRLMGDDGIGIRVVEALGQENKMEAPGKGNESEKVRFTAGETDISYCLGELAGSGLCVIVDGSCSGKAPCSVNVMDLEEAYAQIKPALASHDFDLIHAMKREGLMKEGILVTVEVCCVSFSTELSPLMQERFQEIVRKVKLIIGGYLHSQGIIV